MEHFSTIRDSRAYHVDSLLELRSISAAAISATTSSTGIEVGSVLRKFDLAKLVVNWAAYSSYTATTAAWTVHVGISNLVGGTYTTVSQTVELVGSAAGQIEIPISGLLNTYLDADSVFVRVTATKVGTPGNLTYGAFITLP